MFAQLYDINYSTPIQTIYKQSYGFKKVIIILSKQFITVVITNNLSTVIWYQIYFLIQGESHGVVENVMDWYIVVSEFELQSRYYNHFLTNTLGKMHEPAYHSSCGLYNTTTVLQIALELNNPWCFVGWFYGISTFVGYLTPNPFLWKLSSLFQTIQFSLSTQFNCQKHFYFKLFNLFQQF